MPIRSAHLPGTIGPAARDRALVGTRVLGAGQLARKTSAFGRLASLSWLNRIAFERGRRGQPVDDLPIRPPIDFWPWPEEAKITPTGDKVYDAMLRASIQRSAAVPERRGLPRSLNRRGTPAGRHTQPGGAAHRVVPQALPAASNDATRHLRTSGGGGGSGSPAKVVPLRRETLYPTPRNAAGGAERSGATSLAKGPETPAPRSGGITGRPGAPPTAGGDGRFPAVGLPPAAAATSIAGATIIDLARFEQVTRTESARAVVAPSPATATALLDRPRRTDGGLPMTLAAPRIRRRDPRRPTRTTDRATASTATVPVLPTNVPLARSPLRDIAGTRRSADGPRLRHHAHDAQLSRAIDGRGIAWISPTAAGGAVVASGSALDAAARTLARPEPAPPSPMVPATTAASAEQATSPRGRTRDQAATARSAAAPRTAQAQATGPGQTTPGAADLPASFTPGRRRLELARRSGELAGTTFDTGAVDRLRRETRPPATTTAANAADRPSERAVASPAQALPAIDPTSSTGVARRAGADAPAGPRPPGSRTRSPRTTSPDVAPSLSASSHHASSNPAPTQGPSTPVPPLTPRSEVDATTAATALLVSAHPGRLFAAPSTLLATAARTVEPVTGTPFTASSLPVGGSMLVAGATTPAETTTGTGSPLRRALRSGAASDSAPTDRPGAAATGTAGRSIGLHQAASAEPLVARRAADPVRPPVASTREAAGDVATTTRASDAGDGIATASARPASPPSAPAGPSTAARFLAELRRERRVATRPLPARFRPLARQIIGERPVQIAAGEASTRALRSVGKQAATVGNTIHLDRPLDTSAPSVEVLAHELTHVAHPSAAPRFFDDDRHSAEEAAATEIGRIMARRPAGLTTSYRRPSPAGPTAAPTGGTAGLPVGGVSGFHGAASGPPMPASAFGPTATDPTASTIGAAGAAEVIARRGGRSGFQLGQHRAPGSDGSGGSGGEFVPGPPRGRGSGFQLGQHRSSGRDGSGRDDAGPPPETAVQDPTETTTGRINDFDRLLEMLEDRILAELERRGGRFRGGF